MMNPGTTVAVPVAGEATVSPNCLLHLFSDRLFEPATVRIGGTRLLCGESRVPKRVLAEILLAAAASSLRDKDLVELTPVHRRGHTTAAIELVTDPGTCNGTGDLERAILGVLGARKEGSGSRAHTVEDTVWELVCRHGVNAPLSLSMAEAARVPGLRQHAAGEHQFQVACAGIERFCRDDLPLYEALVTDYRLALARWLN